MTMDDIGLRLGDWYTSKRHVNRQSQTKVSNTSHLYHVCNKKKGRIREEKGIRKGEE